MNEAFYLTHLRFTLRPRGEIRLPRLNKGITLRGAFGEELRRLVCSQGQGFCGTCPVSSHCQYAAIFCPRVPEDSKRLRLNRDLPRPFVIKPPSCGKERYERDEPLSFDLVLVGRSVDLFPYVVLSFHALGDRGIGTGRGRFDIWAIEALDASGECETLMKAGDPVVNFPQKVIRFSDLAASPPSTLRVDFLTPVLLRHENQWSRPAFGILMRRLRDRLNALSYFYCGEALNMDFQSFGLQADRDVKVIAEDLDWVEEFRPSKSQSVDHRLKGWVGHVIYQGEFKEFWPYLWIGQYVHVGKAAAFGQGWYKVTAADYENRPPTS
ncbi:MAG: CRISPR system precrRNA processing endoribonuclease RAMP protein Cas6 [Desulfosoma sp.]